MRAAVAAATALLALAACEPAPRPKPAATPPPSRSSHAALTGGTFVRVEGDGYDQIYVLRPGATAWQLVGDTPKPPLAAGRYWTLAPDGLLGAYIVDGTLLYVQSVDGGPPQRVATAATGETICAPQWSADSAYLTYVLRHATATGASGETFSMAADGTRRRTVWGANTDGACDRRLGASGGVTAFALRGTLWVRTLGAVLPTRLPVSVSGVLALSRDARWAVAAGPGGAYLVDLRAETAVPLPGVPPDEPVAFGEDGHFLAVVGTTVRTFDTAGRLVATSPVVTTRPAATVSLVTWAP